MLPTTRAEISRSRLVQNYSRLRSLARQTPGCDALAVVKADAYGHGVSFCAPWLLEAGAPWLGVTSVAEGVRVRRLCAAIDPDARILVMVGFERQDAPLLLDALLAPTVWDLAHLESLAEAARQRSLAPGSVPVHLEIDTGMSRQGVNFAGGELPPVLERLRSLPEISVQGVFTHFASPEELDSEQNPQQLASFQCAVEQIAASGFRPQWIHAGNSSTMLGRHSVNSLAALAKKIDAHLMLRPGIALYGYALPFVGVPGKKMPVDLQPVLAWKTAIASLRAVEAGTRIGYNGTFVAATKMRLALLPVGYADGLNRKLSSGPSLAASHMLVRGHAAPIVGRISMDLTIVDVSGVPDAAVGDEVTILGEQGGLRITADDHARWAGTIPYEILCAIGARVPRLACD